MGADKPYLRKVSTHTRSSVWPLLMVAVGIIIASVIIIEVVFVKEEPSPELSRKERAKLEQKMKEIDDAEQYALLAATDGLYTCLHSGRVTCFLHKGEVFKYGVTTKGEFGRYYTSFMIKHNVIYVVQFKGNVAECLIQEQVKLFNYPYLPENLARLPENQLPRPPFNPIMK